MTDLPCPFCGHASPVDGDPVSKVLRCNECETIVAYGTPMPRIEVGVHPDDSRFLTLLFESRDANKPGKVQIAIAREYGGMFAEGLLAICRPPAKAPEPVSVAEMQACPP